MTVMTSTSNDLAAIAQRLRDLDICILVTRDGDGTHGRPMSNNGQVEFDGDTWFFARRDSAAGREIESEPRVELAYSATEGGREVSIEAEATIVVVADENHRRWFDELGRWFPEGPEDSEVVLIRATALRVRAWGEAGDLDVRLAD